MGLAGLLGQGWPGLGPAQGWPVSQPSIRVSSSSVSTGLVTWSLAPASRLFSRSPGMARAVTAMIGSAANWGIRRMAAMVT